MPEEKKNLDNLAEDKTTERFTVKPSVNCAKNEHYFEYISGTEVQCTKCPMGYPIGPGTEVRDGHIYIHGTRVI